jgi:hypothetical protein
LLISGCGREAKAQAVHRPAVQQPASPPRALPDPTVGDPDIGAGMAESLLVGSPAGKARKRGVRP